MFFVTCVRTGWNAYEAHFEQYGSGGSLNSDGLLDAYAKFLERETLARPDQWYQFYDFFGQIDSPCVFNNRQPTTDTLTL